MKTWLVGPLLAVAWSCVTQSAGDNKSATVAATYDSAATAAAVAQATLRLREHGNKPGFSKNDLKRTRE